MSKAELPAETTSEKLLPSAAKLFWENGFDGTSTRMLSETLGINKASLYHHIRSKEDLLHDISMQSLAHIHEAVTAAATTAEPCDRLSAVITAHLKTALSDRDMHATMLTELRSMNPEHRAEVLGRRDDYDKIILEVLEDEQAEGRLRCDLSAHMLKLALLNLLNWTIFWYRPDGEQTITELASTLSDLFVHGAALPSD
jgi:AcrR family transcriptional regulator